MKSRSLHNSTKKGFMIFFYRDVTFFHEVPLTPCFPSRNITNNAETHQHTMCDVIIEQPHIAHDNCTPFTCTVDPRKAFPQGQTDTC